MLQREAEVSARDKHRDGVIPIGAGVAVLTRFLTD